MQSELSVAMCTFNGELYLRHQLQSIAAQDCPPKELVICDDGSTDRTGEIIRDFASEATIPVIYEANQRNLGSTRNFEKAISLCQGSIVVLADQDDVWYPFKLSRISAEFAKSPDIVAAFSDADLIDHDSRPLGCRLWNTLRFQASERRQFIKRAFETLLRHPVVTGATMAFRKELFRFMRPFPVDEIHDRWISFLLSVTGQFQLIPEPLMQYRRHHSQQVGPGPLKLRDSIQQARRRRAAFHLEEIDRYRRFRDRLIEFPSRFSRAQSAVLEIDHKIAHLEHRAQLGRPRMARIGRVFWETMNGHYWRYSGGWRSVAKDLIAP
jgi:glycosyltransferase involved in cell wall biosynthesis